MREKALLRDQKRPLSPSDQGKPTPVGSVGNCVADILSGSGRIALSELQQICFLLDEEAFIRYVRRPVLAGSALLAGTLEDANPGLSAGKNLTIAFEVGRLSGETETVSETLQNAIYPLVKSTFSPTANGRFSIGRESGNDIIMPDIALSKCHAAIDVANRSYHLSDSGSTNGTTLNGHRLDPTPRPLKDGDMISFARYEFTFLVPQSLYNKLRVG